MSPSPNSFFPAAQKVFGNSVVSWVLRGVGGLLVTVFAIYIWPAASAWVGTRVGSDDLTAVTNRLEHQEKEHAVDYKNLDLATPDDTGALSHGSQVEWLIIRVKRMQMREVMNTRRLVCLEAKMRMPNAKSDAAKATCKSVVIRYDELIKDKRPPDEAARLAMEFVFGTD